MIIINAHRINSGEFPYIDSDKDKLQDFYFVELEEPEKVSGDDRPYVQKQDTREVRLPPAG